MSDLEVSTDEFAAALEAGAVVIDVRNPDEYAHVRIPGVQLIPLGELGDRIEELPDDGRIYVVCAVGGRSLAAAQAMVRAGYDAVSLRGGTKAWADEGRPVESDG